MIVLRTEVKPDEAPLAFKPGEHSARRLMVKLEVLSEDGQFVKTYEGTFSSFQIDQRVSTKTDLDLASDMADLQEEFSVPGG